MYTTASVIFTDLLGRGVELIIELQYYLKNLLQPTDIFLSQLEIGQQLLKSYYNCVFRKKICSNISECHA